MQISENLSFADLAVSRSLEHNRTLKMLEKISKVVKWENIEALLLEHYEIGTSKEGADAFSSIAADEVHASPEVVPYPVRS